MTKETNMGGIATAVATGTVTRGGRSTSALISNCEVDDAKVTVVKGSAPAPAEQGQGGDPAPDRASAGEDPTHP